MNASIIVHGGAGSLAPDADSRAAEDGCLAAARAGYAVLRRGASALDAVIAAVAILEDDPQFNAGTGSVLNVDGDVEMDAAVMDGADGRAGAVALVRTVKNPILLARLVMEKSAHVFLAGEGADTFAREQGLPAVLAGALVTSTARARWQRARAAEDAAANLPPSPPRHGTVGAVAFDGAGGHVAAATSTGGTSAKRRGRVGDSPLIGCGTYACDGAGAVSCTGLGEAIMRAVLGKTAVDLLAQGHAPAAAAHQVLPLLARMGGTGGLILVDRDGRLGAAFNTPSMAHAWVDGAGNEGTGVTLAMSMPAAHPDAGPPGPARDP